MRFLPALLTLVVTGCSCNESTDAENPPAEPVGDTLVVGYQSDIGNLLAPVAQTAADSTVIAAITMPMMDVGFDCSLKKNPGLATSWEWNDDGTVLKMQLRDDIKWEDGAPVTAEDIAFTYEVVADPVVASPRYGYIEHMKADARPKVIDATHIEWHFTRPYDRDTQMAHTSVEAMPKHLMADADRATLRGHELGKAPKSYGPWRLALWEPEQRFILEPNPSFTGPDHWKPSLSRVIFRIIPEYSSRLIELEAGKIDLMEAVLVEDADRLRETHPEIEIVRRGWRSQDYIGWNLDNPLFKDVQVRKALAMATDIDGMIERLLTSKKTGEKYARKAVSTITPALCGVHNDDITPLSHNVEQAKAMLAKAGWKDTNGDGILDKGGQKFSFTLMTNTGNKRRADISVLFQDQMKQLGIEVNLQQIEGNTMGDRLRKRDYEAYLYGWSAALFVDPSDAWACETEETPRTFNFTNYCNPEVDKLIQQGLQTPDPREAAPIWREVQAKIYEDQPYLFLWWMDELVAIHERFDNYNINVLSNLHNLHEWSVPPEKVKYKR